MRGIAIPPMQRFALISLSRALLRIGQYVGEGDDGSEIGS